MITWTPIEQMPDELKDGREVLVSHGGNAWIPVRWWDDEWVDEMMCTISRPITHFSEINEPS